MEWMFAHTVAAVELAFAGAWASIWDKGMLYGLIALCIGLAFGSQLLAGIPVVGTVLAAFFAPLRKDLLWAAFGCGLVLLGEHIGSRDTAAQYVARTVVIDKVVDKAVTKSSTPAAKSAKDRWDTEN